MANSTDKQIPQKPYRDYPLSPRRDGRWSKKINGVVYTFTGSAQEALDEYNRVRDDLHAGRKPRPKIDGITVFELCTKFLAAKQQQQQAGEIKFLTFKDYKSTCKRIVGYFGQSRVAVDLGPEDFEGLRAEFSKTRKLVALGNQIRNTRAVFKYGFEARLLSAPVQFGPMFKQPTAKALKRHRAQKRIEGTNKDFTAADIRKLLKYAKPQARAMILLGVNCGFGNTDCAKLTLPAVDLEAGWIAFPRSKTGAIRRCPLWPETVKAVKAAIAERKTPRDRAHAELVFITAHFGSFEKEHGCQSISHSFSDLADDCGLKRDGRGFYTLRHVFRTVAGGAKDVEASRLIMGHDENAVEDSYIEHIEDDRLLAVSNHVRNWLFGETADNVGTSKTSANNKSSRTKRESTAQNAVEGERFQLRIVG